MKSEKKIGTDDLIYKAEKETDIQKKYGYQGERGEWVR